MRENNCGLQGTLPIAIGFGAGAESRRPLGLAVVGGLILSQLLTLYITPVTYIYLDAFNAWLGTLWRAKKGHDKESGAVEPPATSRYRAPTGSED